MPEPVEGSGAWSAAIEQGKRHLLARWLSDGDALRVVWRAQHCQRGSKGQAPLAGRGAQRPHPKAVVVTPFIDCESLERRLQTAATDGYNHAAFNQLSQRGVGAAREQWSGRIVLTQRDEGQSEKSLCISNSMRVICSRDG